MAYNLNSGQLAVSSVTYVLPEPTSLTLLGYGAGSCLCGDFG